MPDLDLPRSFVIREASHRVINPIDERKLRVLGAALRLPADTTILDLACGKGELLSTWARDHAITGTGVDISTAFLGDARTRAAELAVSDRVTFVHADAAEYVAPRRYDVAACIGATWIGDGVPGTVALLERALVPGGLLLIGEPFWRETPPTDEAVAGSHASSVDEFHDLPTLITLYGELGYDVVEMVLADGDSWDRYAAAQWLNVRRFIDANPDDALTPQLRDELHRAPLDHVCHARRYLGWGVLALMKR